MAKREILFRKFGENKMSSQKDKKQINPAKQFAIIRLPKKPAGSKEPNLVSVRVNGERIQLMRNEFIPIKKMHINAIRNAVEPVVENEDSAEGDVHLIQRRKIISDTPRFPFELVGWISEKEFQRFRKIALKRSITQEEVDKVIYD